MRIIIVFSENPKKALLIELHTKKLKEELKKFLAKREIDNARKILLTGGGLEKKIDLCDMPLIDADIILTENGIRWDLK